MKKLLVVFPLALALLVPAVASAQTVQQWARKADGICAYYNSRFPVAPDTFPNTAALQAWYRIHGPAELKLQAKFYKQLVAVGLPKQRRTLVQTFLRSELLQNRANARAILAATRGDYSAAKAASDKLTSIRDSRKPVARALGLKVCTKD